MQFLRLRRAFGTSAGGSQLPVSGEGFSAVLRPLLAQASNPTPRRRTRNIAVAVSGGPDSMALVGLTHEFILRENARAAAPPRTEDPERSPDTGVVEYRLHSIIVDHGLRPESHAEALRVQERLESHLSSLSSVTLKQLSWEVGGRQPGPTQELLRDRRLASLAEACAELDADWLLLGQHAQDQAELFLMRLFRGSRLGGLRGMQAFTPGRQLPLEPLLWLPPVLRPLLGFTKPQLLATCARLGLEWEIDRSNVDPKYDRNRARMFLHLSQQEPQMLGERSTEALVLEREYGKTAGSTENESRSVPSRRTMEPLEVPEILRCMDRISAYHETLSQRLETEFQHLCVWILQQNRALVDFSALQALPSSLGLLLMIRILDRLWETLRRENPSQPLPRYSHERLTDLLRSEQIPRRTQVGPLCIHRPASARDTDRRKMVWMSVQPPATPDPSVIRQIRAQADYLHHQHHRLRMAVGGHPLIPSRKNPNWPDRGLPTELDRVGLPAPLRNPKTGAVLSVPHLPALSFDIPRRASPRPGEKE